MNKVLVILGPTATGKTDLAFRVAKKFNGELISCDSRQVYIGLDIGTGKMPGGVISSQPSAISRKQNHWVIGGVRIWGYDLVNQKVRFSVKDYLDFAYPKVEELLKNGALPIIVGGTGLYLRALLKGLDKLNVPVDEKLRKKLENLSIEELQKQITTLSPIEFEKLNQSERKNKRRLTRKVEYLSLYPYAKTRVKRQGLGGKYHILKIGLAAPRSILNQRIDSRVVARVDQGMIKEAQLLHQNGLGFERMRELGLEYACLADLLEGKYDEQKFIENLQTKIHQFARRQMTWFKKEKGIEWFDISQAGWRAKVEMLASGWYNIRR